MKRTFLAVILFVGLWAIADNTPRAIQPALISFDSPCDTPGHRQFLFWVGEWNVYDTLGNQIGENTIELILDNCVLSEHWKSASGQEGKSYNSYDVKTDTWFQTWVDQSGNTIHFEGQWSVDRLVYKSEQKDQQGPFYYQMSFIPQNNGEVVQEWLVTAPDQTSAFTPSQNGDWCGMNPACTDIDLSAYSTSTNIQIRFVGKSGYGNNLYIDNINIGQSLPAAVITAPVTSGCTGDVFTFSDGSGGAFANYNWDFGSNSNPATATGPGPHQVTYSASGNPSVVLNADNGGPSATATTNISINTVVSEFTTSSPSTGLINFNPTIQQSSVDSVAWDFGDGNTSDAFSPSHQYASNGTYTAELTAYNECGSDVFSLNVLVQGIGLDELDDNSMKLFPQPTVENSTIQYSGSDLSGDVLINVIDASGRLIRSYETNSDELSNGFELNLNGLAAGWYQVQITNDSYFWQSPLIKQ